MENCLKGNIIYICFIDSSCVSFSVISFACEQLIAWKRSDSLQAINQIGRTFLVFRPTALFESVTS